MRFFREFLDHAHPYRVFSRDQGMQSAAVKKNLLSSLTATILALSMFFSNSMILSAQTCECGGDRDLTTNCIEVRFEAVPGNDGCYNLIVYNNQWTSSGPCNTYNNQRYLTFEFDNVDCWNNNNVDLEIVPWTFNTTYTPPELRWEMNLGGTLYNKYDFSSGHPSKFTFRRKNNQNGSNNPMNRCQIDTFRLCMGCHDSLSVNCVNQLGIKVYFSDNAGNPICTDEVGSPFGRNYERITPKPPICPEANNCDTGCTLYLSNCNSYSITYGCDYADVRIINDHGFPQCGQIDRFEINISAAGLGYCEDELNYDDALPTFRDWQTTYDPLNGMLIYQAPPGCGLNTCDTFEIRIPFCCEDENRAGISIGDGGCVPYSQVYVPSPGDTIWINDPGSGGNGGVGLWGPVEGGNPGCAGCFFDRDRAVVQEAQYGIDTNADMIPDIFYEDISGCDTLTLFNRNHSSSSDCGDDPTGNSCWSFIELELDPTAEACDISVPRFPAVSITESFPGSNIWTIGPIVPICACDSLSVLICCYNGTIKWKTKDISGVVIQAASARGDYSNSCDPGSKVRVDDESIRFNASDPRISEEEGATLGEPVPNPTTGRVTLTLRPGPGTIGTARAAVRVHNESGRLVATMERNVLGGMLSDLTIDGSGWESGRYFVTVEIDGRQVTTQFVLRK